MSTTTRPLSPAELAKVTGGAYVPGTDASETIQTGNDADLVIAQGGNDTVFTSGGDDQVQAGAGNDYVDSGSGNDLVFGQDGDDTLFTGAGNDQAQGGAGHDSISGGGGSDQLFGQEGNDLLYGGQQDRAADYMEGGSGNDTFVWSPGDGNDQFQGQDGTDQLHLPNVSFEQLQAGLQFYDPSLSLLQRSDGAVFATNPQGQIVPFSGALTVGGETISFNDMESFRLS
ncbi:calcium-binding protein [Muricoccus radiodurans]|uniref:calcium-binding protein n=1 Tax=Muricoccus radiodurans TaxID=2231721 RepID=UPI003CECD5A0